MLDLRVSLNPIRTLLSMMLAQLVDAGVGLMAHGFPQVRAPWSLEAGLTFRGLVQGMEDRFVTGTWATNRKDFKTVYRDSSKQWTQRRAKRVKQRHLIVFSFSRYGSTAWCNFDSFELRHRESLCTCCGFPDISGRAVVASLRCYSLRLSIIKLIYQ